MVSDNTILKKYAAFIEKVKRAQKYIFVIEEADIEKLNNLSYEYTIALKYTPRHFKGNAATLFVEDLFDEINIPRQYVISILGIENTPPIYTKQLASIIGRRIIMEFKTVLPVTNADILYDIFKSTQLENYLKNYGVLISGGK